MEEKDINQLIDSKNTQERSYRNRSIIVILALFFAGLSWLFWTNNQVNNMNDKILVLNDTIQSKESKIVLLQDSLTRINIYLHEADNFKTQKINITPEDRKHYYSSTGQINEVFARMIYFQNREIEFNVNGKSPEEGFNSPSFMTYLLSNIGTIETIELNTTSLESKFDKVSDDYQAGDIVIYKSGYCMMYFATNNPNDEYDSFVFGMTPSGVLALKPDFAEEIARVRPRY